MQLEHRIEALRETMRSEGYSALVCARPGNVLLLTGYWPMTACSIAVLTNDALVLLVPDDEQRLCAHTSASILCFRPGELQCLTNAGREALPILIDTLRAAGISSGALAVELEPDYVAPAYSAAYSYGPALPLALEECGYNVASGDHALRIARATKTESEIASLRRGCRIAERAFTEASSLLRAGITEYEAAQLFESRLCQTDVADARVGGFAWCMSGPDSAQAYKAYARSTTRKLQAGDLVLIHCNSYFEGIWTDITRTYVLGSPSAAQQKWRSAVLRARAAALRAIKVGAIAKDVDRAARNTLEALGYGPNFKHATGHGVGLTGIDHGALPRIHPCSEDALESGMCFNIEPAIYFEHQGGMRHCDVVVLTDDGPDVLLKDDLSPWFVNPA